MKMSAGLKNPGWLIKKGCKGGRASMMVKSRTRASVAVEGLEVLCPAGG